LVQLPKKGKMSQTHQIRLEPRLLSKAFDTDGKLQYTLGNTKNVPQSASTISNHCWDLSKIESEPVPHAYFEVTFDKFNKNAVVGVGIGNQIFVQNQLLGLQQNSFGYLSNGGVRTFKSYQLYSYSADCWGILR
jgi:hypothetical protein